MRYHRFLLVFAVFLTVTAMVPRRSERPMRSLQGHAAEVISINERFQQVFGPAPALASSPFLGLAVLTGAALLIDQPFIENSDFAFVRNLAQNIILRQAKGYASWWLFTILMALAVVTGALNSGKLQGSVGKAAHLVEAGLVAAAYIALIVPTLTSDGAASTVAAQPSHGFVLAGFVPALDFGRLTLIITAGVALIPLMFVRFAFDVLIWLNPFPFIDLLFQVVKTIFSLFFLAVYLINPIAAAFLALLIYIPAILLLPWAARLFGFAFRIIVKPLLSRLFLVFKARLQDRTARIDVRVGTPVLACSANVVRARGLKKRQAVAIVKTSEHALLQPLRRPDAARALAGVGEQIVIGKALAWIEVRVIGPDGRALDQIALPYSLAPEYHTLCRTLGAQDKGHIGLKQLLSSAGQKAKHGVSAAAHAAQEQMNKHLIKPKST